MITATHKLFFLPSFDLVTKLGCTVVLGENIMFCGLFLSRKYDFRAMSA